MGEANQAGSLRVTMEVDVFSEAWWDSKTLTLDGVDTRGHPGTPRLNWIRWRLMDELLRRFYADVGLEVGFGHLGVELYNDALWSPNCARAPRYFGRLCVNHAHSAIEETWGELGDSFRGGTQDFLAEGIWPKWQDYARAAIATLGLESSVVPGHEGCWHRRGKAALPIVFRVALLLRTAGEIGPTEMHDGMYTYPGPEEYLQGSRAGPDR